MPVRLGGLFAGNSVLQPNNKGLAKYAEARLDNTIARAVARHAEALKVDGVALQIWVKRPGSLICTCRQLKKNYTVDNTNSDDPAINITNNRQPRQELTGTPITGETGDVAFKVYHMRGKTSQNSGETIIPPEFAGLINQQNDEETEQVDSFAPLDLLQTDLTDTELAQVLSEGGAVYGGDKTTCGICFSTGRTNSYQLFTGRRLVLDASNEWPYNLTAATARFDKFPTEFSVNGDATSAVTWTVDLPAFTNGWLAIAVRNNLKPANDCQLQWYVNNNWQALTMASLLTNEGTDRRNSKIRVVAPDIGNSSREFTHVELIYATADPILAQMPQITINTNFDFAQPTITCEFEILAALDELPRESVFIDSKFNYVWKVLDSTPKMTSKGQIFGFTINARNVHNSEMLFALKITNDPLVEINYRGIETSEGGLNSSYEPDNSGVIDDFVLPETNADDYDAVE
jgi:hypothetical protein